ncbi:cell division site-positioning protein MapZ family protein [Vaginisenegalia massiliensis]|uniref:cell division site-positioning protein MapZ family protein n=1 Tax=Vaginisenegalia massiliensis TaxID=2058294 RepID=UPI000F53763D|nr:cell division site-positioning protein MapZ family protein [Vaginisenegalia massiliensis]
MSNKVKALVLLVLVCLLVGVVKLYSFMDNRHAGSQPQVSSQQIQSIQHDLNQLYLNDKKDFLKADIKAEDLRQVETKVASLSAVAPEKSQMQTQLEDLKTKYEALTKLNELFDPKKPAIKGDKVATELELLESVKEDQFKEVKKAIYFKAKSLDAFEVAVNKVLDKVELGFGGVEKANSLLAEIKAIPVEDGQIGRIAKKMKELEAVLANIKDPQALADLEQEIQSYIADFLTKVQVIAKEIPGYYDLLLVAVEPSEKLTKAVQENRSLFEATSSESSTESSETQVIESHSSEASYSDPIYIPPTNPTNPTNPPSTQAPDPGTQAPDPGTSNPDPGTQAPDSTAGN